MRVAKYLLSGVCVAALFSLHVWAQKPPADQWPNYQNNSNFSPLTQITPENVTRLTKAWAFSYGGGSLPSGSLSLDFRFEVQPLLIGGTLYVSTPGSPYVKTLASTVTALEPE